MRHVTLTELFTHPIADKFLSRSGKAHAIAVAFHAFHFAKKNNVCVDLATKAALLHDIGHYTWYRNGKWDFELYKKYDIHAIKGAERAHKLLIRCGEHPASAKEIALAVLLHTDSYLPDGELQLSSLQKVVALADKADEEPKGNHHYRKINQERALQSIKRLDEMVEEELENQIKKSV
ncbi:HD domain-containing protein [Bacillus taeanensis]|uniref:Phosphohydrolase n=1 Tax=Bacillus taeanensis TaxID=273032 RepID=A0A366Y134_9BACI|nr:HD domain-containing protein [Bacillus taeanensis]RBW71075.1 phosphohydrolase [Bacillus taeanensis]